ncbi:HAMP domain-containing protein, partial [Microgenomates group bacterium]|nr:HAMP domain-containing protein [Microgenomates group bacterium]
VYTAIKNNMLAGEAPIAVQLFRDFESANFASAIKLYRANGVSAFSDNSTLNQVNKNLDENKFEPKTRFIEYEKNTDQNFLKSVSTVNDIFVRGMEKKNKNLTIYKLLINQPKCSACHGVNHVVRGIIKISSPVDEVYRTARKNIILSIIIYAIVVLILTYVIIMFLKLVVISRILLIGHVVEGVGGGDFKTKVRIDFNDEVGELSQRINTMIDGLNERFKLTKFVSKSTLEHVRLDEEIKLGGSKKTLTVVFSDIRGFTSFSENRDPSVVLSSLNKVMKMQAEIIQEYNGNWQFPWQMIWAIGLMGLYRLLKFFEKKYRGFSKPGFLAAVYLWGLGLLQLMLRSRWLGGGLIILGLLLLLERTGRLSKSKVKSEKVKPIKVKSTRKKLGFDFK